MLLEGKKAVVTGGAQGIGKAIAQRLAAEGAAVAVLDLPRSRPLAEGVVAEIVEHGGRAIALEVDVAERSSVFDAFHRASEQLGGFDIAVNNAGVAGVSPLLDISEESAERLVDVNLLGVLWGIQAAGSIFKASGRGGTIINACSNAGHSAVPMLGLYSATKFGVRALTQVAAQELAPIKVTVNAYSPGIVDTSMWNDIGSMMEAYTGKKPEETFDGYASEIALGRPQTGADVADLVAFLASEQAGYITGQSIITDGGMVYA